MNIMTVEGRKAKIEYDPEIDMFRGEIFGLNGGADFYGKTPDELRLEFKKSLKVFLDVCKEKGIEPYKEYSGKFNLRIPPELHAEIASRASADGKSLNFADRTGLPVSQNPSAGGSHPLAAAPEQRWQ